jgi:hypothetical protein
MSTRAMKNGTASPKRVDMRFSRRQVLGGLGATTALTPFLPLLERETEAAPGDNGPKRLILLFTPNGTLHERWVPTGTETEFTLGQLLAPLAAFQDRLIVLDGMRVIRQGPGDDHQMGMGCMFTGSQLLEGGEDGSAGLGGGVSVDQEVANALGGETPYRSLEFGVQAGGADVWSRMSYQGPDQPIAPEDNPTAMFDRLFADLGVDTTEIDKLKAERRSVIDLVKDDLASLETRYGGGDRVKVEAHLQAIREIERRNDLAPPVCEAPTNPGEMSHNDNDNFPLVCDQMIDQMVMSLACDLTRVASIQFSRSVSNVRFTWEGLGEGHHDVSHYGDSDQAMIDGITTINEWYAAKVAELLTKMDSIPEGDGTMLDNSIVLWGNELSRGNTHGNHPVPFVIAGSGGGALQTGRFLQYGDVEHNRMLVSICNAMGLDTQSFGNNDPGTGGLSGLG